MMSFEVSFVEKCLSNVSRIAGKKSRTGSQNGYLHKWWAPVLWIRNNLFWLRTWLPSEFWIRILLDFQKVPVPDLTLNMYTSFKENELKDLSMAVVVSKNVF
jgi:hypothetical protein